MQRIQAVAQSAGLRVPEQFIRSGIMLVTATAVSALIVALGYGAQGRQHGQELQAEDAEGSYWNGVEALQIPVAEGYWDEEDKGKLTLTTLKFFIEFNETNEDVGVQALLGGEPYRVLKAYDPDGKKILEVKPKRGLKMQGMSDFFFESAEPSLAEFPLADFLERFEAGSYEFETTTIDGIEQDGETILTHVIPAGPVITAPLEGEVVDVKNVIVEWEPVTLTTAFNPPQEPVAIVGYQVIVTRVDPLRVFSVDVPAGTTSVSVSPDFLEPSTEYELEVLAIEASDNQTISLLFFETAE